MSEAAKDFPPILFLCGRDFYRCMDFGISLAWGRKPDAEPGERAYRRGFSLSWNWPRFNWEWYRS